MPGCFTRTVLLAACLVALGIGPAAAEDRALIVGVNAYPELPRRLWLGGAVNDARAVAQWLAQQGWQPAQMRLHTSPAGPGEQPARLNDLRGAMREVLVQTQRGDRVLLYLAGHGAQQPNPAEPDGLDEVFLPADATGWTGKGTAQVPNALADNEIGDWLDALVDRGAKVFAVFDTCHALGLSRMGYGRGQRAVAHSDLGLPGPAARRATADKPTRTDGRWLAFAARSGEPTDEAWLPADAPLAQRRLRGRFTMALLQNWQRDQSLSRLRDHLLLGKSRGATPVLIGDEAVRW